MSTIKRGLAGLIAVLPLLACFGQSTSTYHARADQALQSFLLKFWNGGQQYLRDAYPDNGTLTGYWTYAHGWQALMDGVERTGQYAGWIETFYLGQQARGWGSAYYDDECWMTLALLRAGDLTQDPKYVGQAMSLYSDIMTAWDTTCCGTNRGGLWWDKAHTQKATAANAGAAMAGALLYSRSGSSTYLSFARQVYGYWFTNMVNPTTFQVCDHLNTDGTKVWWRFTYNEGLMIGASVALYEATQDPVYLTNAHSIARFMIRNENVFTAYGPVLYDGDNTGCGGDCHQFKGPAYRYLMQLYALDTSYSEYWQLLKASADALWNLGRNSTSTVFSVNWAGPAQAGADQGQDNSANIALNRFADQFGTYPGSGVATNQYEAEHAVLHHLGVEALYPGFTGWAYIAGWNADGQSVDFNVNCAKAAKYRLSFRYSAGAGGASRQIYINGTNAFPNQSFTNTGSWSSYQTLDLTYPLATGPNTISLAYNSSLGSKNWLNLDNLIVNDTTPEQIRITSITVSASGSVHVTWTTRTGETYQLQYLDSLNSGNWANLGSPITAAGFTTSFDDPPHGGMQRCYRVLRP